MATSSVLGTFSGPALTNEPFTSYAPGTEERTLLIEALKELEEGSPYTVYPNINGKNIVSTPTLKQLNPFKHTSALCNYSAVTPGLVEKAIEGALVAKKAWSRTALHDRAAIFYRAAALLQTTYKYKMMAATMLGQGKNPYQADIDCIAESIDFLKTFPALAETIYKSQPPFNGPGAWNRTETRPIDGFVYSISPFNFTALAVNLVLAPIIVGNVVVWKPSPGAIYSSWLFNEIMIEAGLPAGVLQFLPGDAVEVTDAVMRSSEMGGLHFTGSTAVFRSLLSKIGSKMDLWKSYPRVVGETGGKNFHLIHPTADIKNAALKTIRAAFEYQGQKCSACSRVYLPASRAKEFKEVIVAETSKLSMGANFSDFIGPVISQSAFDRVSRYIEDAKTDPEVTILHGGHCDQSVGYYITPTIIETRDPQSRFLKEEIFGPFICIYVYEDSRYGEGLFEMIESTTGYALTGAVFAKDRTAIIEATEGLRFAAGNFYVNDQCTGAMPGHQPFGGSKGSGTNDKAGTAGLLTRFISQRTIKESFYTIDSVLFPSNAA